jgi:hypothetical protein
MKKTDPASEKPASKIPKSFCPNTRMDFSQSWQAFRANYKAFLFTELFAGMAFTLTTMLVWGTISLIYVLSPNLSVSELYTNISEGFRISRLYRSLTLILGSWVFFGFLNCQFGLAYDIMSSGDQFAEFKSSFSYFKKFWWQYPLLTFLLLLPHPIFAVITNRRSGGSPPIPSLETGNLWIALLQLMLFFILVVFFVETFPSLTAHGRFKDSFIENSRIVRHNWRRLITTWGVYTLIFLAPGFLIGMVSILLEPALWLFILGMIYFLLISIFGFPMLSLISTGIYNNVQFTHTQSKKK